VLSAPNMDCYLHSLLCFFKWVPNHDGELEESVEEIIQEIVQLYRKYSQDGLLCESLLLRLS